MDFRIRQGLIVILLLFSCEISFGKDLSVGIGYSYLYARQWDKAIQTYNFSRPFLTKKQPLIVSGITLSSSYLFSTNKRLMHGLSLSYSYYRSSSSNENLINTLSLHIVKPGYDMHLKGRGQHNNLSVDIIVSALFGGLYRSVNHSSLLVDDKRLKAFGVGGAIDVKCAYRCLSINKRLYLAPYLNAGYSPYFFAPNFEPVINQTKQLTGKASADIISLELGIILSAKR